MLDLNEWLSTTRFPDKPWLVLGKGPTFDRRGRFDLTEFNLLGLNHVVDKVTLDVAHMIDIDVVESCAASLAENTSWLVMPRYPNVAQARSPRRLEDYFDDHPVLRDLDARGRLIFYNLSGAPVHGMSPIIGVKYFSSEAALGILAQMGVTEVRSLGIDGGRAYASSFRDLSASTLMANGQPVFDIQFDRLAMIAEEAGIDYRPLVPPLRIFIGTDESQVVAHRVLEYSIRSSASVPVEVTPMLGMTTPMPKDPALRPRTAFSFNRFLIPKLCGYQGRALYLDADMVVYGDVAELAELDFGDQAVLCTNQPEAPAQWRNHAGFHPGRHTAVMLLDCDKLRWEASKIVAGLDEGRYGYHDLMTDMCIVAPDQIADDIPREWNHLERYEPGVTKLLHYTVVPTQPWKNDENPLVELWMGWYRDAVADGAVPPEEVEALMAEGMAKPSLAAALGTAPSRKSVLTNASMDLAMARHRIARLEAEIESLRQSRAFRLGNSIVETLRSPRDFLRRNLPAGRRR